MKRILFTIAVAACATCHAEQFFTGAYWTTKAPLAVSREAGQCDVTLYDDNSCIVRTFYNGNASISATGTWSTVSGKISLSAANWKPFEVQPGAKVADFTAKARDGFVSGKFSVIFNGDTYKGSWQATLP